MKKTPHIHRKGLVGGQGRVEPLALNNGGREGVMVPF